MPRCFLQSTDPSVQTLSARRDLATSAILIAISRKTRPKDASANLYQLAIEIMYCKYLWCKVQAHSSPRAARRSGTPRAPCAQTNQLED